MADEKQVAAAEFDAFRDTYSDQINSAVSFSGQSHDFFTKMKALYLKDLLAATCPGAEKPAVLDVGCGHGLIHPYLTTGERPAILTGVDVAQTVVDEARALHPENSYDAYDGERLPYDDASFDAAFTICVMHHVPPPQWPDFLAEMRRVVRPGGLVAVFEHNPLNPVTRHIVNTCPIDENAVLLRSGQLKRLAQDAGLAEVARRFILFTPIDNALFSGLDRMLGWLPLGAQYYVAGRAPG